MSRKAVNWTEDRIAKAEQAIRKNEVIRFRNEPDILYVKEPGWFISNPETLGMILSKVKIGMLPVDMDFAEADDMEDYDLLCSTEELSELIERCAEYYCFAYAGDDVCKTDDFEHFDTCRECRDEMSKKEIQVIYFDKTHEDCGFNNTSGNERITKPLELFKKMNLYPYVEGDDDNYVLSEGAAAQETKADGIDAQKVTTALNVVTPMLAGLGLTEREKAALVKQLIAEVTFSAEEKMEIMKKLMS